jgi:hypothetical protein
MATNVSVALGEVTRPTKGLNIVLWILQILAAATFFLAGGSKLGGVEPVVVFLLNNHNAALNRAFSGFWGYELGKFV